MTVRPYPQHVAEAEGFSPFPTPSDFGADMKFGFFEEEVTLATDGLETETVAEIPANAIVLGVMAIVTTTITTSTAWSVGDTDSAARYAANNTTLTAGEKSDPVGVPFLNTVARKVMITATVANPGAGKVRVLAYYLAMTLPTS
jgi:hypothetical protein